MAPTFKNREEEQIFKRSIDLTSVFAKTGNRMDAVESMRDELKFLAGVVLKQDPSSRLAAIINERMA